MEELIRLKSRIDSLRDDEFITFITSYKKNYLSNIFFQYFKNELIKTNDIEEWRNDTMPNIHTMTNKIDNIINARDDDDDDNTNKNNASLDGLPSDLISSISSFLNFKDTLCFEKTSRCILIGSRSPISIKTLSSPQFAKCAEYSNMNECIYNFYRFRRLKKLNIDFCDIYKYIEEPNFFINNLSKLPIWNNLEILSFENDSSFPNGNKIMLRLKSNLTKLCNVTTFKWEGSLFCDGSAFTKDIFPNLQFLHLDSTETGLDSMDEMFDFSKLNGLSITQHFDENYEPIINKTCHRLQSFHAVEPEEEDGLLHLNKMNKFPKLTELCLTSPIVFNKDTMNVFLSQDLNHLERIYWNISKIENDINDYKESIKGLFCIKSLKYLSINTNTFQQIMMVFEILRNALKNQYKSWIKIRIIRCEQNEFPMQDTNIRQSILNLVDCLQNISDDFMLICDINNIGQYFMYHNNKYLIKYIDGNTLIISNKGCRINEYHQQWIMNCDCCNI